LAASRSIIRDQRDRPDVQEVVLMLADFSFTPPEQILAGLKQRGNMPGMGDAASAGGMGREGRRHGDERGQA
jgi:hypothetical protein